MKRGDKVKVITPGRFEGYTGVIARTTQRHRRARRSYGVVYWVTFDYHPWQKEGQEWGFAEKELELLEREREHA